MAPGKRAAKPVVEKSGGSTIAAKWMKVARERGILIKPRPDGSSEVCGRFAGVKETNPLFNAEQFARNHLLGERGELKTGDSFINKLLPNQTGFGAMLQRAEQLKP